MQLLDRSKFSYIQRHSMLVAFLIISFIVHPFCSLHLQAQEQQKTEEKKVSFPITAEQLKVLEGIFQNPRNPDMYVQFTKKENGLMGKLLWNNREIGLNPESALTFISTESGEEGPVRVKFNADSSGTVSSVSIGNNEKWKKVYDYKPVVKTEMAHTPAQLKPFEGIYQLANGRDRYVQFTVVENKLVLKQHWDGTQIDCVPLSELEFFSKESPLFNVSFSKEPDGSISKALIFKRDSWVKLKKAGLSPDQLKLIAGKYQFKEDPDNYIQITIRQNNIVVKQLWDGREIVLSAITENYFYNNEQSFPLQVIKDKDGVVTQVELLGMDLFNKLKD